MENIHFYMIRRIVDFYRFNTDEELEAPKEIYRRLCPLLNYYNYSVKIFFKERLGGGIPAILGRNTTGRMGQWWKRSPDCILLTAEGFKYR
jgi:hypothetical protein